MFHPYMNYFLILKYNVHVYAIYYNKILKNASNNTRIIKIWATYSGQSRGHKVNRVHFVLFYDYYNWLNR
jgi:hypothetical protein